MSDRILVIGSGGREHALAWKLSLSSSVKHIYVAPGNAGTHSDPTGKVSNCALNVKDHAVVAEWCKENSIDLVVVGPEDPLANGLADYLKNAGIKCFGPCQKAAQIEASKEFAKNFMDRHKIPTARWKSFTNAEDAKTHILSAPYDALVVKASGLAAGKGVIVGSCKEDAVKAVDTLKQDKGLASASTTIVIEELLKGEEVSVLCFSDGTNISVMPPAQDHKRLLDNDEGPNTGGMGAYCKCPLVSEKELKFIKENILQKAIDGMKNDGTPYVGVLYAGLMMTKDGPKVLEYNCRFGDPETQVILPLLKTDLYDVMLACVNESLGNINLQWLEKYAVGIVLVSGGYPGSYAKGKIITGLDKLQYPDYLIFHAGTSASGVDIVTSGGRVLALVVIESSIQTAVSKALRASEIVQFEGKFYRKDIAHKALKRSHYEGVTYKSAGVDIESAEELVNKIKVLTKETLRSEVCGDIGGFGGIFDLAASGYIDPYLISRGRGIGEKLKIAQEYEKHELIGNDLVANCVNEIVCHGAEPLFFLDTYTCGKLDINTAADVIIGISKACKKANCALIGGETAEMPGMYAEGDYDLTAFARGAVERHNFLPNKKAINDGDVVIGLISNTVNTGSFSTLCKLIEKEGLTLNTVVPFEGKSTFQELLMKENKIYVKSLLPLMRKMYIKAAAYISEGGLTENIFRILPTAHKVILDASKWLLPPLFNWFAVKGNFSVEEMISSFNCGLDVVLIVNKESSDEILMSLKASGETAAVVGHVTSCNKNENCVEFINSSLKGANAKLRTKVAVLTSGNGINLECLIDYTRNLNNVSSFEVALIISHNADPRNIEKAEKTGIRLKVLHSEQFKKPEELEMTIHDALKSHNIELICLDDFSHELSSNFIKFWEKKILNIHPSILPAFNCANAHREVINLGARITGCTVYFLQPEEKFGDIIEQAAVNVDIADTEASLQKKVSQLQHYIYPRALDLVSCKKIFYGPDSKLMRLDNDASQSAYMDFNKFHEEQVHQKIISLMKITERSGFNKDIQYPCGVFDLKASGYENCLLVSGTDGVGTKLKVAQACNKHDTIGIDLVAMCVNDILTHGAEPLFFLECFDCGKLDPALAVNVVSGIVEGCKQANCALIGAEISQIPDIYLNHKQGIFDCQNYDVVGYAEGALVKKNLLPKLNEIKDGDVIIGLASSGIHSNGYSLVRKIVKMRNLRYQDPLLFDNSQTLGEALLTPTKIYVKSVLPLMKKGYIKAAAHITGGGLKENIPRILPPNYKVKLDASKWNMPSVFKWIAHEGHLSDNEMLRTFNCGIGMILIADKCFKDEILNSLKEKDESASCIGIVSTHREGEEKVEVQNLRLLTESQQIAKKRVGVLISGSGTNLQALIDYTQNPANQSKAEIVLVLSNVPGVEGLKRAERANIPTKVLSHKAYKSRVEFDMAVHSILQSSSVDIVCLAGFMRILSKEFVELWQGRLLNVHPALLPAFKGMNAHKQVLQRGARITGCTVHFVEPEVDAGAIIEQAAVRVDANDTEKTLQEKVKELEHKIFPSALELLASGRISRDLNGKLLWQF